MNGEEIISDDLVKFGDTINYPPMENKTEEGIEYVFVWVDSSYDGKPMPAKDLTIVGNYQEKAEAPIYFGTFRVKTADYDSTKTTQYFDASAVGTETYGSIAVKECVGDGSQIRVPYLADEYYASLNYAQQNKYKKENRQPYCFLIPNGLTDKYNIRLLDGALVDHWVETVTDNEIINYNGNEYIFYVYYTDKATPVKISETTDFTLELSEK